MFEYFKDLVDQLNQVPGGPAVLLKDYFAKAVREPVGDLAAVQEQLRKLSGEAVELKDAWLLLDGAVLCLTQLKNRAQLVLQHDDATKLTPVIDLPVVLLQAALRNPEDATSGYQVSPLVLSLLAIAMGGVDDKKQLAKVVPQVDYCAKGLLLIASCRLCG